MNKIIVSVLVSLAALAVPAGVPVAVHAAGPPPGCIPDENGNCAWIYATYTCPNYYPGYFASMYNDQVTWYVNYAYNYQQATVSSTSISNTPGSNINGQRILSNTTSSVSGNTATGHSAFTDPGPFYGSLQYIDLSFSVTPDGTVSCGGTWGSGSGTSPSA